VDQQLDVVGRAMQRGDDGRLQFDDGRHRRWRRHTRCDRDDERGAEIELRAIALVDDRLVIGDVVADGVRLDVAMHDRVVVGVVALVDVLRRHERDRPDRGGKYERGQPARRHRWHAMRF